jgi:subtilisin family serine protease
VAVIDTGIDYLHPDLAANMWTVGLLKKSILHDKLLYREVT